MPSTPLVSDKSRHMDERAWWDLWNTSYRTQDGNDATSSELFERAAAVANEICQTGANHVLEVGCGTGTLSRMLNYATYLGNDISPAAIDLARQKSQSLPRRDGASLPAYEAADFHDWPLPQQTFDLAICVDAVVCFRDQQFAMKKIAQSLQPNGWLVLTAINPFVYERIRRTATNPLESGPVSHWLSRGELHALVESAGLTIERSYSIMPRGNRGILRLINARRLNEAFGPRVAAILRRLKELAGLGQYRVIVARKGS